MMLSRLGPRGSPQWRPRPSWLGPAGTMGLARGCSQPGGHISSSYSSSSLDVCLHCCYRLHLELALVPKTAESCPHTTPRRSALRVPLRPPWRWGEQYRDVNSTSRPQTHTHTRFGTSDTLAHSGMRSLPEWILPNAGNTQTTSVNTCWSHKRQSTGYQLYGTVREQPSRNIPTPHPAGGLRGQANTPIILFLFCSTFEMCNFSLTG